MEHLGSGAGRKITGLPFGCRFKPTFGDNFQLVLASRGDFVTPAVDGCAVDAKSPGQGCLSAKVGNCFVLSHDAKGLTCLTGHVKNIKRDLAYSQGMEAISITDRINARISETAMSNADLARRCHVSRATVTQWRNGSTTNIRPEHLVSISDALGLEIRWLITGRGQRLAKHDPPTNFDSCDQEILNAPPEIKDMFRRILSISKGT